MRYLFWVFPVLLTITLFAIPSGRDPVQDYLRPDRPRAYADNTTGADPYYSDDKVFRLDVDLNNDGKPEVLVSSTKDKDGKQGNIWTIYEPTERGFRDAGTMTFSRESVYLGSIDEIGSFGFVAFHPAGGGEGTIYAYVLDNSGVREIRLGEVKRNPASQELEGRELLTKYPPTGDKFVPSVIRADQLAHEYGVKVESRTSQEAAEELLKAAREKARHQTPLVIASPSQAPPSPAIQSTWPAEQMRQSASPTLLPKARQRPARLSVILLFVAVLVLAGLVITILRRKSL